MKLWSVLEVSHDVSRLILKKVNFKNSLLVCPRMALKNDPVFYAILHAQEMVGDFDLVACTEFKNILPCIRMNQQAAYCPHSASASSDLSMPFTGIQDSLLH